MEIDIAFGILMLLGLFLGITRGAISSLFSFVGWLLGALVAVKWSHNVSLWLQDYFHTHSRWMPFLTFLLLFISVIIIVHLLSKLLEASFSTVGLSFVDKLVGAALWCAMLTFVLSIMLWFGNHMEVLDPEMEDKSRVYAYVQPIAPYIIGNLGKVLPWFKDAFEHLQQVIGNATPPAPSK